MARIPRRRRINLNLERFYQGACMTIPFFKRALLLSISTSLLAGTALAPAHAQDKRKETLIVANETGPNMLDVQGVGANRPSYGVAWISYDRLMTFGKKKL